VQLPILGIPITVFDLEAAVIEMAQAVGQKRRVYACTCPVYTLMQAVERPEVRAALAGAAWVTPDGMPVVWALRRAGASGTGRVYGPDLLLALSAVSAKRGYRQYYYGGGLNVASQLSGELQRRFPELRVAGCSAPPFRELTIYEERAMLDELNGSGADIIWVGLGSPKQDLWMARYRDRLEAPLLVGVGAAFDFFSGRQRQAPHWIQHAGLEWLFRLISEPRRLWRRYLIYNTKFILCLARQGLRRRLAG
jgi:N-acetylglucosaminyldiphosphoundecaprenol N-acetyl-beta-D-mannosaminyltransferase